MTELDMALGQGPPARGDKVEMALYSMGDDYTEKFLAALEQGFTHVRLAQILAADSGWPITASQITHYRRKLREKRG
jgi:hypothetical protein